MFADEYPHTCRRCKGGTMTAGTCPGCRYILDTFGASFDKPQRPARGARGLDQLRDELQVPRV